MSLIFAPDDAQPINDGGPHKKCSVCNDRQCTWTAKSNAENVPMCGWCLLYSSSSDWGVANDLEMSHVGQLAATTSKNKSIELDDHGRLSWGDAERFVLGIYATSRAVLSKIGVMR